MMSETQILEYATSLRQAHGPAAEAEAAKRARELDDEGKADEAADWRRIRAAITTMRGPGES